MWLESLSIPTTLYHRTTVLLHYFTLGGHDALLLGRSLAASAMKPGLDRF